MFYIDDILDWAKCNIYYILHILGNTDEYLGMFPQGLTIKGFHRAIQFDEHSSFQWLYEIHTYSFISVKTNSWQVATW